MGHSVCKEPMEQILLRAYALKIGYFLCSARQCVVVIG